MGCIPSKNKEKQSSEKANLLAEEVVNDISTHPGQAYDMSLSPEEDRPLSADRKTGSQYFASFVKQSVQNLIDVPSLVYTLYGTHSPYNYCEDYKDVITSVKVVDGVLNVNTVPEFDSEDSVDNLLTKPSSIDYVKLNHCGEELEEVEKKMNVTGSSLVVHCGEEETEGRP